MPLVPADAAMLTQWPCTASGSPDVQPRAIHQEPVPPGVPGTPVPGCAPQRQLSGQAQEPPVHLP